MYKIAGWIDRYEVSFKGLKAKEGELLRAGPLDYIRLKVHGHTQGTGYRRLQEVAGDKAMEVFGIFCKFLEISGNQPRGLRGFLLNEHDKSASIKDLSFILGVPEAQIGHALTVLTDKKIEWVVEVEETQLNSTQLNSTQRARAQGFGNFQKHPENSGNSLPESETNILPEPPEYSDDLKKVVHAWEARNSIAAASGIHYEKWRLAVNCHGVELCLKYIEKIKNTEPGFIVNQINKDVANGKVKAVRPAIKCVVTDCIYKATVTSSTYGLWFCSKHRDRQFAKDKNAAVRKDG